MFVINWKGAELRYNRLHFERRSKRIIVRRV